MLLKENIAGFHSELENAEAPATLLSLVGKKNAFTILHDRVSAIFLKALRSGDKGLVAAVLCVCQFLVHQQVQNWLRTAQTLQKVKGCL